VSGQKFSNKHIEGKKPKSFWRYNSKIIFLTTANSVSVILVSKVFHMWKKDMRWICRF